MHPGEAQTLSRGGGLGSVERIRLLGLGVSHGGGNLRGGVITVREKRSRSGEGRTEREHRASSS